jgi:ribosomal protein S18 acetylase RimI-like enzyme
MTGASRLAQAIAATWPPAGQEPIGPFLVPRAGGGGNRVSAARLTDLAEDGSNVTDAEIEAVAQAQHASGREALFMLFGWQGPLDDHLARAVYRVRDATDMLLAPVADLAAPPPPVSCFEIWPPLAVIEEIWAEGGIGPERLAVMHRVRGPKTALFGRTGDRPAGAAFVAIDLPVAMLHALEVRPRARRQGLARIMVRAAAAWAQENGAEQLAVLVTQENTAAQALYASVGLSVAGQYHYRAKSEVEP